VSEDFSGLNEGLGSIEAVTIMMSICTLLGSSTSPHFEACLKSSSIVSPLDSDRLAFIHCLLLNFFAFKMILISKKSYGSRVRAKCSRKQHLETLSPYHLP